jgi:hypothetical protein
LSDLSESSLSPPLWRQLQLTAQALAAIRSGTSGSVAFDAIEPAMRPGVQSLGFQVLRRLGRAEALRRHLAKRTPPPPADALLCTALALAWEAESSPYEPFTLVDQTVEAAKRNPATRAQASFINACLRRFLRERDELVAVTEQEPVAQWNHPRWWIERLQARPPARMAARAGGRQRTGADDAARQRPEDPSLSYLLALEAVGLAGHARRRQRPAAGPRAAGAAAARFRGRRLLGAGRGRADGGALCCSTACCREARRRAAARARRLRRPWRQDRAPARTGRPRAPSR